MGLKRLKEKARSCGGAHNVVTLSKDTYEAVERAHRSYIATKHEEEDAYRKQELKGKEELNKKKQEKASLNKVQKKCSKLDTKQSKLDSDVAKTTEEVNIAKPMLKDANNSPDQTISEGNMITIKIVMEMIAVANKKIFTISSHLEEQAKVRNEIGQKRRTFMENLLRKAKKKL